MEFRNITVAGSGVLGSQIAFQTAFKGFDVAVYDINEEAVNRAKDRIANLQLRYRKDLGASKSEVVDAFKRIYFYSNLAKAVPNADLVIEAVPEVARIKTDF